MDDRDRFQIGEVSGRIARPAEDGPQAVACAQRSVVF